MLKEAIFGGPPPSPDELRAFLRRKGVRLPARVTATSERVKGRGRPISLHAGLTYWFVPVTSRAKGPSLCHGVGDMIRAIQQAILLHRREQLQGRDAEAFSDLAETQAFHLAIVEMRGPPDRRGESLRQWLQIVIARHQAHIHEIRRRLVEFLAALTRGVEMPLGYPFASAVRRISETFDLLEIREIFSEICQEFGRLMAGSGAPQSLGVSRSEAVGKAFRFMEARAWTPIGLREVAEAAHVSSPHLARLFRRETGRTVGDHLLFLRVTRARELLATTDRPPLDVAAACGFESVEHFYRIFRRLTGLTPGKYRKARQV